MFAQVSKADSFGGGASHVASMLHHLTKAADGKSHHIASWSGGGYNNGIVPLYGNYQKTIRALHNAQKKFFVPEYIPFEFVTLFRHWQRHRYSAINFHDLSSAISPLTLYLTSKLSPVFWTIHDCSPFTAGCLYPMSCNKYIDSSCRGCPRKGEWPIDTESPLLPLGLSLKKFVHSSDIQLITPSNWMKSMIENSAIESRNQVKVIPNGVDTRTFNPHVVIPDHLKDF